MSTVTFYVAVTGCLKKSIFALAKPLTKLYLDKMIEAQDDSPPGLRDKILLLMGYETMRKRAELVGFEFKDVTCLLNGKPALRLGFSKANQYGEGRLIGFPKT